MSAQVVVGFFTQRDTAEMACTMLRQAGVPDEYIGLSTDFAADAIAAEMPGQAYSNQPGQASASDSPECGNAGPLGDHVVCAEPGSHADRAAIETVLRLAGAREVRLAHGPDAMP